MARGKFIVYIFIQFELKSRPRRPRTRWRLTEYFNLMGTDLDVYVIMFRVNLTATHPDLRLNCTLNKKKIVSKNEYLIFIHVRSEARRQEGLRMQSMIGLHVVQVIWSSII